MGVRSKKELKPLLCHLFPPLSPFGLVHQLKTELLIEVASGVKSLKGLQIDLFVVLLPAEGDSFLHQFVPQTSPPNLWREDEPPQMCSIRHRLYPVNGNPSFNSILEGDDPEPVARIVKAAEKFGHLFGDSGFEEEPKFPFAVVIAGMELNHSTHCPGHIPGEDDFVHFLPPFVASI